MLFVFVLFVGVYEGALFLSWCRIFLSVVVLGVIFFGWLLEYGFIVEDSVWMLWIRLVVVVVGGVVIGTVFFAITGAVLSEFECVE